MHFALKSLSCGRISPLISGLWSARVPYVAVLITAASGLETYFHCRDTEYSRVGQRLEVISRRRMPNAGLTLEYKTTDL